jgi:hypothetical protein
MTEYMATDPGETERAARLGTPGEARPLTNEQKGRDRSSAVRPVGRFIEHQ